MQLFFAESVLCLQQIVLTGKLFSSFFQFFCICQNFRNILQLQDVSVAYLCTAKAFCTDDFVDMIRIFHPVFRRRI